MTQPLFHNPKIQFEKVAYATKLEDDPDEWSVSVIREAYKQLPFLKSFESDVELDRVDPARGYAVGKIIVYPAGMKKEAAAGERRLITVPVIVRDRELSPLDVFSHQGHMWPMDEEKVQGHLFRPGLFDRPAVEGEFSAQGLIGQTAPPTLDGYQNLGTLAKTASVWEGTRGYFRAEDVAAFRSEVSSTPSLRSPVLLAAASSLEGHSEKTASEMRESRLDSLKPDVVQIVMDKDGYVIKTANCGCYSPKKKKASRKEVSEMLSKKAMASLLSAGHVTFTVNPVEQPETEKRAQAANRYGFYEVVAGGREHLGVVVPRMIDLQGRPFSSQVFLGDSVHAMQEKVAGVYRGEVPAEADSTPRGKGVFVYREGAAAVALEPVDVRHVISSEKIASYVATRLSTGEEIRIVPMAGLKKVASLGENRYAIPTTMSFLPMRGARASVVSDPADIGGTKVASLSSVQIRSDGLSYEIRGQNARPFAGEFLNQVDAEFALASLGIPSAASQEILKTAAARGLFVVHRTRPIITEEARALPFLEKAASAFANTPVLRKNLLKEAAALCAPKAQEIWKTAGVVFARETADTILSLNFITPENASLYVSYLPEIEKVSSKLAELLVASRLGMDDVRESAAKNAMTQVNAVVRGLETLRERVQ